MINHLFFKSMCVAFVIGVVYMGTVLDSEANERAAAGLGCYTICNVVGD